MNRACGVERTVGGVRVCWGEHETDETCAWADYALPPAGGVGDLEPPRPGTILLFQGAIERKDLRTFRQSLAECYPEWAKSGGMVLYLPPNTTLTTLPADMLRELLRLAERGAGGAT